MLWLERYKIMLWINKFIVCEVLVFIWFNEYKKIFEKNLEDFIEI